jgi:hypothetical protein
MLNDFKAVGIFEVAQVLNYVFVLTQRAQKFLILILYIFVREGTSFSK